MAPLIRRLPSLVALTVFAAALSACSSGEQFGRTFGFIRDAPDEFTVTTRAPLAMPPSFGLPPPRPGMVRPQEQSERAKAELALVPQMALGTTAEGSSPGQQALIQAAGPPATSEIRSEVDQEALRERSADRGLGSKLMFWRKTPPPGIVVDPEKEAQRLRENAALGQSPETGDTPIVQPKSRAWLEGIF